MNLSWLSESSIKSTHGALTEYVVTTPVWPLLSLSERFGLDLHAKLELFQRTGTFKARGAFNVIRHLSAEQLKRGVTAVSGGNHAVAVAYAARKLGTSAKVVMPATANSRRRELCQEYGAEIVIEPDIKSAFTKVSQIVESEGRTLVHPFEGEHTILGTSGVGLELIVQVPDVDAVIVPIGGGGLCAGVSAAVKQFKPDCEVYGVEPTGSNVMHLSFASGKVEHLDQVRSIADSLGAPMTAPLSLEVCRRNVTDLVTVTDEELRQGMRLLFLEAKLAVEPAGAAALAAAIGPLRERLRGKTVGLIVCGANIDFGTYQKHMETKPVP